MQQRRFEMKVAHKDVIITLENQEERDAVQCACLVVLEICNNSIRKQRIADILYRNGVKFSKCGSLVRILTALSNQV